MALENRKTFNFINLPVYFRDILGYLTFYVNWILNFNAFLNF